MLSRGLRTPRRSGSSPYPGPILWGVRLASLAVFVALWEVSRQSETFDQLPSIAGILRALSEMTASGELLGAFWTSNQVMILGLVTSMLIGIPIGLLMGWVGGFLARIGDVYVDLILSVPVAAIIPLIVMAVGLGMVARTLVVVLFVAPIIVVNARTGIRTLPPGVVEMSRVYGIRRLRLWTRVLLPGAMTGIVAGLRLGLGRALTGMILAELLLINAGIGRIIVERQSRFESDHVMAITLAVIIEATVLLRSMEKVERRLLKWAPDTRV